MNFAPQQNWQLYATAIAPFSTELSRNLTTAERFEIDVDHWVPSRV